MKRIAGLVFLFLLTLSAFAHAQTFTLPPLPPLAVGPGPTVTLEWEYPIDAADLLIGVGGGYRLYEANGDRCDDPSPLPVAIIDIAAIDRAFNRVGAPVVTGLLCYEITAFNSVGESVHSERAASPAEAVIPAMPTGVTITPLGGP